MVKTQKQKQLSGYSLSKGKRGEREIVKLLSTITGTKWLRVPCSGALRKSNPGMRGDVYCVEEEYLDVVIEVKNYKGATTINDLFNKKSVYNSWLKQLREERLNSFGILFFKSNRQWFWVIQPTQGINLHSQLCRQLREVSVYQRRTGMIIKKKLGKQKQKCSRCNCEWKTDINFRNKHGRKTVRCPKCKQLIKTISDPPK